MRYFTDVTLAFLAVFLCTTAVAAEADVEPGCIVPLVIFNSLPKPFELSALIPGRPVPRPGGFTSQPEIPIRLVSVERLRIPIISNARIAPTQFRLQDQKLLAGDDDARLFPIREIFPYLLTAFAFGDDDSLSELNFTAGYACDTTGNVILQLFVEDGVIPLAGFSVTDVLEGQQVYIRPEQFGRRRAVDVPFRISGGL